MDQKVAHVSELEILNLSWFKVKKKKKTERLREIGMLEWACQSLTEIKRHTFHHDCEK